MPCQKCKGQIQQAVLFCTECFLVNPSSVFRDEETPPDGEKQQVLDPVHALEAASGDTWDLSMERYAASILRMKAVLEMREIRRHVSSRMLADVEVLLKRARSTAFQRALTGAIKAGETSLINALLGHDLVVTGSKSTASLTKFRRSETGRNFVKTAFYTETEWTSLWQNINETQANVFLEECATLRAEAIKRESVNRTTRRKEGDALVEAQNEVLDGTDQLEPSATEPVHPFSNMLEKPEGDLFDREEVKLRPAVLLKSNRYSQGELV